MACAVVGVIVFPNAPTPDCSREEGVGGSRHPVGLRTDYLVNAARAVL